MDENSQTIKVEQTYKFMKLNISQTGLSQSRLHLDILESNFQKSNTQKEY